MHSRPGGYNAGHGPSIHSGDCGRVLPVGSALLFVWVCGNHRTDGPSAGRFGHRDSNGEFGVDYGDRRRLRCRGKALPPHSPPMTPAGRLVAREFPLGRTSIQGSGLLTVAGPHGRPQTGTLPAKARNCYSSRGKPRPHWGDGLHHLQRGRPCEDYVRRLRWHDRRRWRSYGGP